MKLCYTLMFYVLYTLSDLIHMQRTNFVLKVLSLILEFENFKKVAKIESLRQNVEVFNIQSISISIYKATVASAKLKVRLGKIVKIHKLATGFLPPFLSPVPSPQLLSTSLPLHSPPYSFLPPSSPSPLPSTVF